MWEVAAHCCSSIYPLAAAHRLCYIAEYLTDFQESDEDI